MQSTIDNKLPKLVNYLLVGRLTFTKRTLWYRKIQNMKNEILDFLSLNPWSAFFTLLTFIAIITAIFKSLIIKEFARAFVILLIGITLIVVIYYLELRNIGIWIDEKQDHAFIYFIILFLVKGYALRMWKFNNPISTTEEKE